MIHEVLRRLAATVLLIAALLTVVFVLVHLAPGDPVDLIVDPDLDDVGRAHLRTSLGLDRPLLEQYGTWISGAVRGDFGRSLQRHRPVSEIIAEALPRTMLLTGVAYAVHLTLALLLGVALATRRGSWFWRGVDVAGLVVYSLPAFWLALMLILVFARHLGWLPAGGMQDTSAMLGAESSWLDVARHLVLPVFVLGAASAMGTARFLRTSLLEILGSDHVMAARARGIPEGQVIRRHALRNVLLPVITLVGINLPALLGGAVVTETVFAWPGMGRVTVDAIFARDYPVVMATTVLSGVLVVLANLLADLLYSRVDPRVRLARRGAP